MYDTIVQEQWVRTRAVPVPKPVTRCLRGYAFDPSLSTALETAVLNEIVFKVPWEADLLKGPVGEYLEVVDYDPASGVFYEPVDLNHASVLAQDGLAPSEGNPQFHQQMVYAVAMTTIRNFEKALGRTAFWAEQIVQPAPPKSAERNGFVQRLRIYPHALREANAYYSPAKKALLFGYFPAITTQTDVLPGGIVFTCLSHDIVAHETAHALVDGMNRRFIEATNPDVLAFHEAFADVVALFQHFTFPEILRYEIGKTRGELATYNLLGQLAQQFGKAIGNRSALRDALGETDPTTGKWHPHTPDPAALQTTLEPHARGAILVAALFDAFLTIYNYRVADLLRIATSGTGVLPAGTLHPDLVNRLAGEAVKASQHLLNIVIRALDYCPPVDLTFGDFLRAMITADSDMVPDDDRSYRVALIEAFRRHGIYPQNVRTLSVDSLRWQQVREEKDHQHAFKELAAQLRDHILPLRELSQDRRTMFTQLRKIRENLHDFIRTKVTQYKGFQEVTGLVLDPVKAKELGIRIKNNHPVFEVHAVHPARRARPDGGISNQVVLVITQQRELSTPPLPSKRRFRGGCTLIFDLDSLELRYCILKAINDETRVERQESFAKMTSAALYSTYFTGNTQDNDETEPFAMLHRFL